MKFKVGDRVKVTGDYCSRKFDNNIGTVVRVYNDDMVGVDFDNWTYGHSCHGKGRRYHCWNVSCSIVTLCKTETIVIYHNRKDNTVVAKNTATDEKAIAKCHPDDEFNFNIGAKVAFDRLMGIEPIKEEPKYYTGRVVCIKGVKSLTTTGKIYEFVNGVFTWDDGTRFGSRCKTIDDINRGFDSKFIEVVE